MINEKEYPIWINTKGSGVKWDRNELFNGTGRFRKFYFPPTKEWIKWSDRIEFLESHGVKENEYYEILQKGYVYPNNIDTICERDGCSNKKPFVNMYVGYTRKYCSQECNRLSRIGNKYGNKKLSLIGRLKKYIRLYGVPGGIIKLNERLLEERNPSPPKKKKIGHKLPLRYRLIKKYGKEVGESMYESELDKYRYRNSEKFYIDKYGEDIGKKIWKDILYRRGTNFRELWRNPTEGILKASGNRGTKVYVYSKYEEKEILLQSNYEKDFFLKLSEDINVTSIIRVHGLGIEYTDSENINHNYIPDFIVNYNDGKSLLIEVKPRYMINNELVLLKRDAAINYCRVHNMTYVMVTEEWIYHELDEGWIVCDKLNTNY